MEYMYTTNLFMEIKFSYLIADAKYVCGDDGSNKCDTREFEVYFLSSWIFKKKKHLQLLFCVREFSW